MPSREGKMVEEYAWHEVLWSFVFLCSFVFLGIKMRARKWLRRVVFLLGFIGAAYLGMFLIGWIALPDIAKSMLMIVWLCGAATATVFVDRRDR